MKTILNSIATGSLLAMLAVAQPQRSIEDALLHQAEMQPASSRANPTVTAQSYGRPEVPASEATRGFDTPASVSHSLLVYVITGSPQFGAVDLHSGTFLPIGPSLPLEVGDGLVQGPGKALLTLGFSGNLVAIDPVTGITSVVGQTGLGDCTTPASPCGPNSANGIGRFDGAFYATDFANNLYSLNPKSGAARLIGLTGIPALPFSPLSVNADGSQNVFNETLFSARGKLYANFAAAVRPQGGPPQTTFPACRAQYPGGPDQVLVGWRVARSRAGFFPVRAAFPVIGAGSASEAAEELGQWDTKSDSDSLDWHRQINPAPRAHLIHARQFGDGEPVSGLRGAADQREFFTYS